MVCSGLLITQQLRSLKKYALVQNNHSTAQLTVLSPPFMNGKWTFQWDNRFWLIPLSDWFFGGPCRDRTCDHLIKSQMTWNWFNTAITVLSVHWSSQWIMNLQRFNTTFKSTYCFNWIDSGTTFEKLSIQCFFVVTVEAWPSFSDTVCKSSWSPYLGRSC